MDIRYATLADLDAVAAVEAECFPAASSNALYVKVLLKPPV